MSSEIFVISPELTAGSGGLADYTLRVVDEWQGRRPVRFLLPRGGSPTSAPEVETIERSARALREKLPGRGGKVLLQYSAYGFDRIGYPRWLLRGLSDWKRQSGGRLVIMFHEIWTFWPMRNRNYLVQQLHRRDLAKLNSVADAIFTSTADQAEHLRKLTPGASIEILPVGSNIGASAAPRTRTSGLAVLFGLEGSRLRALREMEAEIKSVAGLGRITKLITVGGGNTDLGSNDEQKLLSAFSLSAGFEQCGALAEEEVSELLAGSEFGLSAQDELSLTKSGTFMAYAAHGLNVLSPHAGLVRPPPLCWLTHPAELSRGLSVDELSSRAQKLQNWQAEIASWSKIAGRFAEALEAT